MNIVTIASKNFWQKKEFNSLSVVLMALAVGIIIITATVARFLEQNLASNSKGIDLVVGAKGSPLQLILSAVYQVDAPTGNIALAEAQKLMKHPLVKKAIPLAMGDSYLGYRLVGTNAQYYQHYQLTLAQGKLPEGAFEVALGHEVAQKTKLSIGTSFESTHGMAQEGQTHAEHKYRVVGILASTGQVADRLALTTLESFWEAHEHDQEQSNSLDLLNEEPQEHEQHHTDQTEDKHQELTALLVSFRSPLAMMALPRHINQNTNMQAALPSIEINRLLSMLGIGLDALKYLALLLMIVAGISVVVLLYQNLKERKYELALMNSMGASRGKLFSILLIEGLLVGLLGSILGVVLAYLALWFLAKSADQAALFNQGLDLGVVIVSAVACLAICFVASAIPTAGIYKSKLATILAER
jgi:putative ABC transport system permease protein